MSRAKKQNKNRGQKRRVRRGMKHRGTGQFPDLREVAAQLPGCWLCGGPVDVVGAFFPDDPDMWPGPPRVPGKFRVLFYGLCAQCFNIPEPERSTRVHALMKAGAPC